MNEVMISQPVSLQTSILHRQDSHMAAEACQLVLEILVSSCTHIQATPGLANGHSVHSTPLPLGWTICILGTD